ncbi:MAG: aminoacetone oxidase family FAD-binding enzyme [Clostridiales bacterium]|nr:aminoacetone oxidase family FAD-binding enzyme [Clostridiales bacterium]
MTYDCVIVGAGAAGLYCAARILASRPSCRIAIIDSNHTAGKKLLLTGGGRCNLTNSSIELSGYNTDDIDILRHIIEHHDADSVIDFFSQELGVMVSNKDSLYYPATFRASTVVNALCNYLSEKNAEFIFDERVVSVVKTDSCYVINNHYRSRSVVVAAGGASYPKTGSDGNFVTLLSDLTDPSDIVELHPALVPLVTAEKDTKRLSGAKVCCSLKLYPDASMNECIDRSRGELLFTDYGISGILVLDISGSAVHELSCGFNPAVSINLLNDLTYSQSLDLIKTITARFPERRIIDALAGLVRDDVLFVALNRIKINKDTVCRKLTSDDNKRIAEILTSFVLTINGYKGYEQAQITSGGIKLSACDELLNLRSSPGLFVCGESLNCNGICGGYNLQFAWSSASLAAEGVISCLK